MKFGTSFGPGILLVEVQTATSRAALRRQLLPSVFFQFLHREYARRTVLPNESAYKQPCETWFQFDYCFFEMDDFAREFRAGGTDISGEVGFPLHLQVLSKEDVFRKINEP